MRICLSAGGNREPNRICLICLLEVRDKDRSEEDSSQDHPVQTTNLLVVAVEGPLLRQHLVPQADQRLIPDLLQLQAAELGEREEISTVPIILVEEFSSVKFVKSPILEGIDLRGRNVIIVDSWAIIKRNVLD